MSDGFHALPPVWMALLVFGVTFLGAAAILWVVRSLAVGDRARAFKGASPGLLPPLGIIFGLLVAFLAAQAWGDLDRVHAAVNREASALRTVAHDRPFIGPTAVQPTALLQVQPDPADARR